MAPRPFQISDMRNSFVVSVALHMATLSKLPGYRRQCSENDRHIAQPLRVTLLLS